MSFKCTLTSDESVANSALRKNKTKVAVIPDGHNHFLIRLFNDNGNSKIERTLAGIKGISLTGEGDRFTTYSYKGRLGNLQKVLTNSGGVFAK